MDQDKTLQAAHSLQKGFENVKLNLLNAPTDLVNLAAENADSDDVTVELNKDPAMLRDDLTAQVSYIRKLKFQFIEQNAKDRYTKSIVSSIDEAPIVSDEDNRILHLQNQQQKAKLRSSKIRLAEMQNNVRTLAPKVEEDYASIKQASAKATELSKKILDARLALSRLRQAHPHPRLTIQSADQKLADQIVEMQELMDESENIKNEVKELKHKVKDGNLEVENLRLQRAEAERNVKVTGALAHDDRRLVPLYDWFTASLALHRSVHDLIELNVASDNELRLTYDIDGPRSKPHSITITLIFQPSTHQLAAAQLDGLQELGVEMGDVVDSHVQVNDVHGLVAAVLARARQGR